MVADVIEWVERSQLTHNLEFCAQKVFRLKVAY